ncbi:MAG: ATPase, T2SS/T4P/T4SS family, partial [Candidatus Limnocylindrales bacterium]
MSLLERVEAAKRGTATATPGVGGPRPPVPGTLSATDGDGAGGQGIAASPPRVSAREENFRAIRAKVGEAVADALSSRIDLSDPGGVRESLAREIDEIIAGYIADNELSLTREERRRLVEGVIDEVAGFGPIEPLLADATVTEVMVNGPNRVYIERAGRIEKVPITFRNDEHVLNIIDRIITPIGRHIDETSPRVDARLPDGSRVNAIIKPLSLVGPVITVRKFATRFSVDDLIGFGTATAEMFDFLKACVEGQLNIFLSGGTGSGKTTTLNVLSSFIPEEERIVTIEDAAELQLSQKHVITLEARPANLEGTGEITIRDLLRNALHMRPDRIVVGECRAGEALDMVQAMTTGHDGSLSTGHANTPRDMLRRLETMILMTGYDLPLRAIREQIASAVDVIVHTARLRDGTRKIVSITEVYGVEDDDILTQEIFRFEQTGVVDGKIRGELRATGIRPTFMPTFEIRGVKLPPGEYGIPPQDPSQPLRQGKARWSFGGVSAVTSTVPPGLGRGRAVVAGGMAYVSAVGPVDPASGQVDSADIKLQTRQCLVNLKARLEEVGSSLDEVVWANWSLREASEFDAFYEEWLRWFPDEAPVGQGTLLPLSHRRAGFRVSLGVIAAAHATVDGAARKAAVIPVV